MMRTSAILAALGLWLCLDGIIDGPVARWLARITITKPWR